MPPEAAMTENVTTEYTQKIQNAVEGCKPVFTEFHQFKYATIRYFLEL